MLSKDEAAFIKYWEANRLKRKKLFRQFLVGIPLGLLIVIPTVVSLTSGWYKRAEMEANSADFNPMVLFIALLVIVGFTAIFHQRWKWEQYEQRYLELLAREERISGNSAGTPHTPDSPTNPDSTTTPNSSTTARPVPSSPAQSSADPNPSSTPHSPTAPGSRTTPENPHSPTTPDSRATSQNPNSSTDPDSPA